MRRLAVVVLVLGCGAARPEGRVEVALDGPNATGRIVALSTSAACVISGPGDLEGPVGFGGAFSVYSTPTSDDALITVFRPTGVQVAWTDLPNPFDAAASTRARVRTGGGSPPLARVTGWASLEKRAFQLRREAEIVPAHVWLDGGLDVEVRGFHAGRVYVARKTYLLQPTEVIAMAHCADVAYEPKRLQAEPPPILPPATLEAVGNMLHLRGQPDGAIVYELALDGRFDVGVTATQDAWRRVEGRVDRVRFDGWVLASELAPMTGSAHGRLGGAHMSRPPTIHPTRLVQVVHETPLLMGADEATARPIGVLEVGAKLDTWNVTGDTLEVRFYPWLLTAPDGMRLFARAADLLAQDDL